MRIAHVAAFAVALSVPITPEPGEAQARFDEGLMEAFEYRNMGPFRMGARIADMAFPESRDGVYAHTMYVAPWTGGLFKTTNYGTTWDPIFDGQSRRLTVGDVTLAPSNPEIVWVGTGDAFTSRSSYAGDGVYKSLDGGDTWEHLGLVDTHHIARIAIHPTNPDIVYVAAMGHLYSTNEERGVYRTTDGGESWEKVLYIDERIGVIDLVMNPEDPSVLYAATFDKVRLPWQLVSGGPESAIYKTTDGGESWSRLGGGLPEGRIGRIGLDIYRGNPDILYAIIDNTNPPPGVELPTEFGARQPVMGGEVYRTDDAGATWRKMNLDGDDVSTKGPYYFNQIRVDPNDDMSIFLTGSPGGFSEDGGRSWRTIFRGFFGDNRTFWFDPNDPNRMVMGSDGGIAISYDRGQTSDHYDNLPIGEAYMVAVDMEDPYNVYAGLQDHEHWKGPSTSADRRGISQHEWLALGDGDGMWVVPDQTDSRWFYSTRHYGGLARLDQVEGYETNITPQPPAGAPPYRFIWTPPLMISPHDSEVIYAGAQVLLRSPDRGDTWEEISPDLSTNPAEFIMPESEGRVPGGIPWFAISVIDESTLEPGVIWVGTSDGKVQLTRDGGGSWEDMTAKLVALGAREEGYVSRVRASKHEPGRAYVSKRAYKYDDFRPFLYTTDDYGTTWRSISGNLPDEPINVVWEDERNPNLLFVGNDVGVFVSIDRGQSWVRANNNVPHVPVHDLVVHPRENDLVLGTWGRSLWVTNIAPLQELSEAVLAEDVHFFQTEPTVQRITWSFGANDYLFGQRFIQTPNEPSGMIIRYYLREGAQNASVTIRTADGLEVARLNGSTDPGINTVAWSTQAGGGRGGFGRGGGGRGGRGGGGGAPAPAGPTFDQWDRVGQQQMAPLGSYTLTLEVDGQTFTQTAEISGRQGWSIGAKPQVIR